MSAGLVIVLQLWGLLSLLATDRHAIREPMDQAHISFQIHLPAILDVNNVTLSFPLLLALLPPMSLAVQ